MMLDLLKSKRLQAWVGATLLLGLLLVLIAVVNGVVKSTASPPAASASGPDRQTRVYKVKPGTSDQWARLLTEQFGAAGNVSVVPDTRSDELLVLASDEVHQQIAAQLPSASAVPTPAVVLQPVSTPAVGSPAPGSARRSVSLWNVDGRQFETNLTRAVGRRLMSRTLGGGHREYLLTTPDEQQARLRVDPHGNRVSVEGAERPVEGAVRLVHALDHPRPAGHVGFVPTTGSRREEVRRLIQAVQMDGANRSAAASDQQSARPTMTLAAADNQMQEPRQNRPDDPRDRGPAPAAPGDDTPLAGNRLVGPVHVEVLEGLDAIIIKGRPEDVKRVQDLVDQLVEYSKVTEPEVQVVLLKHADATAVGTLLEQLYDDIYAAREGTMSITPLAAPNGLLLIGREESIEKLSTLIGKLDQPIPPASRFRYFRLKHCPAEKAQESITQFFAEEAPEGAELVPRVNVVHDFRSNSLIVRASPRDMEEVAAIIARLDSEDSESFNQVRVFKLKNASAEVLAPVLQDALTGQMYGQRARSGRSMAMMSSAGRQDFEAKSTRLQMITIENGQRRVVSSGILTDAQVTADTRTNSVVVTASADSMPLVAALVRELDLPPTVEACVKVFTLTNGDASTMRDMLESIFTATISGEEVAVKTGVVKDDTSLVELHFAADVRTNSVIATGSAGALVVVEAVVARLDGSDPRQRKNTVYRLSNYKANDVADAVNQYLSSKRIIESDAEGVISEAERVAREVIVVAEAASNSLIISATPRYFDEVLKLVKEIDQRPAMAAIQVVIAEVALDNFDEFGIELSLEDSLLFNRALATAGGLQIPGSLFSNGSDTGGQAMTSLGTGQVNTELNYGGLVLSASSESVSALIRALSTCRRLKVLSRPQIMTLNNQQAQIIVGEDVPFITGTSFSEFGQQNSIDYREVGLILNVTPIITPDGFVVMEIVATNSKVGPVEEGIPVTVADGTLIRSPRIEMINAQTVVSAFDGQTVVLGGLIIEEDDVIVRRVPVISTIPVVGNLFRYEAETKERKELLIIMTPRIVKSRCDAQRIACIEASRLHWCRADVERLHGGYGGDPFFGPGRGPGPQVIYPDETPTIDMIPGAAEQTQSHRIEVVPTPQATDAVPAEPSVAPPTGDVEPQGPSVLRESGMKIMRPVWQVVPSARNRSTEEPAAQHDGPHPSANETSSRDIQRLPTVRQAVAIEGQPRRQPVVPHEAQPAVQYDHRQPERVNPAMYQQGY